jgi:inorganic pyrophosphatase
VNAFIEIARGESTKYEFDMARNGLRVDRELPASLGGMPVGYGFVPNTISFDGDPLDALVLGDGRARATLVQGRVIGVMYMTDEKGRDGKVVLVPAGAPPDARLSEADRDRIGAFFDVYKRHEADAGKFSRVEGWGDASEAFRLIQQTSGYVQRFRSRRF